jgi:hypothetical protein
MAAERDTLRRAAEEQIRKGREAAEFLAQMQLAQEQTDAVMEMESEQRLSTLVRGRRRGNLETESEGEDFKFVDSGKDSAAESESSVEVVAEKVSKTLYNCT